MTVRTADPAGVARLLTDKYGLASTQADGGLTFLVEEGDAFIVKLLHAPTGHRWKGSACVARRWTTCSSR